MINTNVRIAKVIPTVSLIWKVGRLKFSLGFSESASYVWIWVHLFVFFWGAFGFVGWLAGWRDLGVTKMD